MATLDISGKMTFPGSPGGADAQVLIGAPNLVVATGTNLCSSTGLNGLKVSYNEKAEFELNIAAGVVKDVSFGSIDTGKMLYMGSTQAITYKLNGGVDVHQMAAGGCLLSVMQGITELEITGGSQEARVYVLVLGD
jgi:hypothetical protein